jgi:hypothetical protein
VAYHVKTENIVSFNMLITEVYSLQKGKLPHIPEFAHKIISLCHNSKAGHVGLHKTLQLVDEFLKANPIKE